MWSFSSRDLFELSGREKSVLPFLTLDWTLFSERTLKSGQKHQSGQLQKTLYRQLKSNFSHQKLNSEEYGVFDVLDFGTIHADSKKHKDYLLGQGLSVPVSIDKLMI